MLDKKRKTSSEVSTVAWDLGTALKLRFQGVSHGDIAKYFQIPKSTLQARLRSFEGKITNVPEFKEHRADILAAQQARVLLALSDADIKKASARDKAIVFGTLYDKERLERGLSTQNSAVVIASAVLEADKLSSSPEGDDHKM